MPIFITQGRYTQSAMTEMIASPEDRAYLLGRTALSSWRFDVGA